MALFNSLFLVDAFFMTNSRTYWKRSEEKKYIMYHENKLSSVFVDPGTGLQEVSYLPPS